MNFVRPPKSIEANPYLKQKEEVSGLTSWARATQPHLQEGRHFSLVGNHTPTASVLRQGSA